MDVLIKPILKRAIFRREFKIIRIFSLPLNPGGTLNLLGAYCYIL
jgi:hypothetical protein